MITAPQLAHRRGAAWTGSGTAPCRASLPSACMTGNPFSADIFPDGLPVTAGPAGLHAPAIGELRSMVERAGQRLQMERADDGGGTVVLLRAPRAGFGKSHLLARLAAEMGERAFVVPVPFDREREVLWSALLWQVLESFHHGRAGAISLLDLVTRRTFALVNQRMIVERHIPCAHPQEALAGLEARFVELFDFSDPGQPVARWFAEHFERLVPVASRVAGHISGLSAEAAAHWLRILCAYAQGRKDGETVRWEGLRWSVLQPSSPPVAHGGMSIVSEGLTGEAGARERVVEFFRMAAAVRPLVLVFDELDLFYEQRESVQRIAGCITELRRLLSRTVQVLSVNQDLWQQTFLKSVPSAIEDRLTGNQITLGTMQRAEAEQLIRTRLSHAGLSEVVASAFLHRLNLAGYFAQEAGRLVSPRAVLRHAAAAWEDFERSATAHHAAPAEVYAPPPFLDIPDMPEPPPAALTVEYAPFLRFPPEPPAIHPPAPSGEPAVKAMPEEDPAFSRLRETLQRLLTPLPPEDDLAAPPPGVKEARQPLVSGVILPDPPPPALPLPHPPRAPAPEQPRPPDAALQRRFQQLRSHFLTAPWLSVDQDRLFHLLKATGRRLAVMQWVDHPLPGSPGQTAGAWDGPDGEVLFGSEPYEDRTYWSALMHYARERSGHGYAARVNGHHPSRLVVFSASKAPVNLTAWMSPDEIIDARTRFLDVQTVDQSMLATLYAADELMREAARGQHGVNPEEVFAALVPHLEFLWKRAARPPVRAQ